MSVGYLYATRHTVTAVEGDAKVTTFTGESGRYSLDLAPGRYMCQINVVDEVGCKFAFPRAPLVVVP